MWVESDTHLPDGESLVRQVLHGKRFFRREFGKEVNHLWFPDCFGYSAAVPQILAKAGIRYFVTMKLAWSQFNKMPHHSFHWRGIDGSEVLAHLLPEDTYHCSAKPDRLAGSSAARPGQRCSGGTGGSVLHGARCGGTALPGLRGGPVAPSSDRGAPTGNRRMAYGNVYGVRMQSGMGGARTAIQTHRTARRRLRAIRSERRSGRVREPDSRSVARRREGTPATTTVAACHGTPQSVSLWASRQSHPYGKRNL